MQNAHPCFAETFGEICTQANEYLETKTFFIVTVNMDSLLKNVPPRVSQFENTLNVDTSSKKKHILAAKKSCGQNRRCRSASAGPARKILKKMFF